MKKKTSLQQLAHAVAAKKGQVTRSKNKRKEEAALLTKMFAGTVFPLQAIIRQWDKTVAMKERFRPLFREYGLYSRGQFLLELCICPRQTDTFGVFMIWNITNAKMSLGVFEISRSETGVAVGEIADPVSFTEANFNSLQEVANLSEKDLLRHFVKSYAIEKHEPEPLVRHEAVDMAGDAKPGEWEKACLELSTGCFDGSKNVYKVLAEAEEHLLMDTQKIIVLATKLKYPRATSDAPPERYLTTKTVAVGYLRKMFLDMHKTPFTLEWYREHCGWVLTVAAMHRIKAPLVLIC